MAESIYYLNEQGKVVPVPEQWQSESLTEKPFADEKELQELVANHPELLSGEQMTPDDPRRWILIKQEQGISDTSGGGIRWSLDILFVDQDAVPTLAEVKLSSNSEIRRAIVGQMLDYAANAQHTWNAGGIRQDFKESSDAAGRNPDTVLAELLQSGSEPDADEFWQTVETNLREARMRLLFVADGIRNELARVVEFLNGQMPSVQVLAVEVKQFASPVGRRWKTRVIDRAPDPAPVSARTPRQQNRINYYEFLSQMPSPEVESAASRLLYVATRNNAKLSWDKQCVKIDARCPSIGREQTVAWLYIPSKTGWMGSGGFVFGAGGGFKVSFEQMPDNLRKVLWDWPDQFSKDAYASESPRYKDGHKSRAISHEAAAANIDVLEERLENVLRDLQQLEVAEE